MGYDTLTSIIVFVEDKRFYKHFGIDIFAIVRAFLANIRAGKYVQGGSTITQQLARTVFLSNEKTLIRKIKEAFKAIRIERTLDKYTILEWYVMSVYMGQRADGTKIKGFWAASEYYFNKHLLETDTYEKIQLVAMLRGPNKYKPGSALGKARSEMILKKLTI